MKLIELLKVLGNENVIITDSEQVEVLIAGAAKETTGGIWKEKEVLKFEKLPNEEIFETNSHYYEITINI